MTAINSDLVVRSVRLSGDPESAGPVRFADRGGLLGLLFKNAILTFLTLGIYRFWAKASLRRYWWGSITLMGDPLEYTGTGTELFIGALMFIGVMVPFVLLSGLVQTLAAAHSPWAFAVQMIQAFGFLVLIQFVTFRARRYRLSRTLWRGVRASQDGSSLAYLKLALGWTFIGIITLGIATPWARVATTRYLMDRMALGTLKARFDGRGRDLLWAWLLPYLLFLVPLVIGGVMLGSQVGANPTFDPKKVVGIFLPLGIMFVGYVAGGIALLAYFFKELRYTIDKTSFGEARLHSGLPVSDIVMSIIGFGALVLFVGVILLLMIGFIAVGMGAGSDPVKTGLASFTFIAAFVLIFNFTLGILRIYWIDKLVVRSACDTMTITNAAAFDQIGQSTAPMPRAGEGMADAFDIGAF